MRAALGEAQLATATGDVPVGAVVLDAEGVVVGRGRNPARRAVTPRRTPRCSRCARPRRHSVMAPGGCTLVVTLEPCAMCAGAVVLARMPRVVLGAWDPKAGVCGSVHDLVRDPRLNHRVEVLGGVLEAECGSLLREFFDARRV